MEDNLKRLRIERGQIKSALTRLKRFLDTSASTASVEVLQERQTRCASLFDNFNQIQNQIEALLPESEHADDHDSERDNFETTYYDYIGTLKSLITKLNPPSDASSSRRSSHSSTSVLPEVSTGIKLPNITLPSFDGTYGNWVKFRDTFESLIHNNDALSRIQKFHYLNSALKGSASRIIHSLGISDANYTVAWKTLKARFEDSNTLIDHHMQALFELSSMSRDSYGSLRQLLDDVNNHVAALKSLREPTDQWDTILSYLVKTKLDAVTKNEWEKRRISDNRKLTFADMTTFLEKQCRYLEKSAVNKGSDSGKGHGSSGHKRPHEQRDSRPNKDRDYFGGNFKKFRKPEPVTSYVATAPSATCSFCKGPHSLFQCKEFRKLTVQKRRQETNKLRVCYNCLNSGHIANACTRSGCQKCGNRHNTLLHVDVDVKSPVMRNTGSNAQGPSTSTQAYVAHGTESGTTRVLLSTAIVYLTDKKGVKHECRALLDSGSQSHFITEKLYRKLGLPRRSAKIWVSGLGQSTSRTQYKTDVTLTSRHNGFTESITCLVIDKITDTMPNMTLTANSIPIPPGFTLADPKFYEEGEIDILIGAGLFWDILCVGQYKISPAYPLLQKTKLGWILAGNLVTPYTNDTSSTTCYLLTDQDKDLQPQLKDFWEIEENAVHQSGVLLNPANECERHFRETTSRNASGRYIVSIPFTEKLKHLGSSKRLAEKRLLNIERKLERSPELQRDYREFMKEYEELGHMVEVTDNSECDDGSTYYFPHHPVIRADSSTTKVRVVFDGSAKTSSGISLNEVQRVGPTVQDDLFSIIVRFRKHRYVLSADIAKMYRQILVDPQQRRYQRILWRSDPTLPIKTFELQTVTYGTAAAPFLATRTLRRLGEENEEKFPAASRVIQNDFYVDDLLTGTDTKDAARSLKRDLSTIMVSAGFELRKWISNDSTLLGINQSDAEDKVRISDNSKILGLLWAANRDELRYSVKTEALQRVTKRTILSAIAQIFDPLGLVGPAIVQAKMMLQRLWQLKVSWDESLPQDIHTHWTNFHEELASLNNIIIPRRVTSQGFKRIELHGFCDASEKAYGACIYVRSLDATGRWMIQLLCAKSRVAPLKKVSLPRLELCGALLLAQLARKAKTALGIEPHREFFWSDSMVALAWIRGDSSRWKTFVANRTSEIQQLTNGNWNHVASDDNPADIISRGIMPAALLTARIWWNGPRWLSQDRTHWPTAEPNFQEIPELMEIRQHALVAATSEDFKIFDKYSSFTKLLRVTAYCLRFINNLKATRSKFVRTNLSAKEIAASRDVLVKLVQRQSFNAELTNLRKNRAIPRSSSLNQLNPFIDSEGLLRVGGRLTNAPIPFEQRHPIILPTRHKFTKLLILDEHRRLLHAGRQAVLSSIRTRYWPLSGNTAVKDVLRKCVKCFRLKPIGHEYLMGNLPASRVTPSRPFSSCGIDYAGPLLIKEKTRSRVTLKAYICIFVCFSTKAVHIELATDLTTDAFLNCLRRFIARRGLPTHIYSDNGTNFVGARNDLGELEQLLFDESHKNRIADFLARETIQWHLIPPSAPHFGGLWESAVKSAKYHLRRVIGETRLTFEELYTILTQIEACLNSRPLCPLSNDPSDLTPLTPGHFLIGTSLTALPHPTLCEVPQNRLTNYQLLQQMFQHFWKRWGTEYLHQLQQRNKWRLSNPSKFGIGTMVLIKDDHLPPMKWKLGRIVELHPGTDDIIRVVSVKTSDTVLKRPVTKICILPSDDDQPTGEEETPSAETPT